MSKDNMVPDQLLWDYIDGLLSETEAEKLILLCSKNDQLLNRLEMIRGYNRNLKVAVNLSSEVYPALNHKIMNKLQNVLESDAPLNTRLKPQLPLLLACLMAACLIVPMWLSLGHIDISIVPIAQFLNNSSLIVVPSIILVFLASTFVVSFLRYKMLMKNLKTLPT